MIDIEHFYIFWTILCLAIWGGIFYSYSNLRHEMLTISVCFGVGGVWSQYLHIRDWWQPITVTGTSIGVEDFLIGFALGGIASVCYDVWIHDHSKHAKPRSRLYSPGALFLFTFGCVFLLAHYMCNLVSFYAAVIAYISGISFMYFYRKDLAHKSILSGGIFLLFGAMVYWFLFVLFPGYIDTYWYLPEVWYAEKVLGIPSGEYIWFFLTGAFIGPLYEFCRGISK